MPIYEYTCRKCNAHIEAMQKISDKPLTRCQKCKGKLEKEWSRTSFQLKGAGWYVTDYAGKKSDAKETKAEPAGSSSSTTTTTETKTIDTPKKAVKSSPTSTGGD
ncbi:MAG: FmdB family zinc ribbon protein [Pyrinomonadaceae bacterium]